MKANAFTPTVKRGSLPRRVRAFRVQGEKTEMTLEQLCDEIETLANEMRQVNHINHASTIMHLAADAAVTYGANDKLTDAGGESRKD